MRTKQDTIDVLGPRRISHQAFIGAVPPPNNEPERRVMDLQERILGPMPGKKGQFLAPTEETRPFAQPTEQQLLAAVRQREEALVRAQA